MPVQKLEFLLAQDLTVEELRALDRFIRNNTQLSRGQQASFHRRISRQIWKRSKRAAQGVPSTPLAQEA